MSNWHDPDDPMFPFYLDEFVFNDEDKRQRQRYNDQLDIHEPCDERDDDEEADDDDVEIIRDPVQSSNVASVGYDDEAEILEVEFLNGSVYRYYDVPVELYDGLLNAESVGSYLYYEVIKQGFAYEKIEEGTNPVQNRTSTPVIKNSVEATQPSQQIPEPSNVSDTISVGAAAAGSVAVALFHAIKNEKLDVIRILLRNNPKWVNAKDKEGQTPLHYAVMADNIEIVKFLIKCRADVNAKDDKERTSLHWAIGSGWFEIAKYLIELGADVNAKDSEGQTILHIAISHGHIDLAKMLIDYGADVNAKNKYERTPLHPANQIRFTAAEQKEIDEYISKSCLLRQELTADDTNGCTSYLHSVAGHATIAIVKFLVSKGANVNAKNENGYTVLHVAAELNRNVSVIKLLISIGADFNVKDNDGYTPLHSAAEFNMNVEVVQFLVSIGANVNAKDNNGRVPFDLANRAVAGYLSSVRSFATTGQLAQIQFTAAEQTLFSVAEQAEINRFCATYRSDNVKAVDEAGETLLHKAATWDICVIKFLISKGANVNAKNKHGKTPLHYVKNGVVFDFLISKGAEEYENDEDWDDEDDGDWNDEEGWKDAGDDDDEPDEPKKKKREGRRGERWEDIELYDGVDRDYSNDELTVITDPKVFAEWFPDEVTDYDPDYDS